MKKIVTSAAALATFISSTAAGYGGQAAQSLDQVATDPSTMLRCDRRLQRSQTVPPTPRRVGLAALRAGAPQEVRTPTASMPATRSGLATGTCRWRLSSRTAC